MPGPCYYHPDAPSTGTCVQCGMPICALDTEIIAAKTVCRMCVGTVRARLEREMASPPAVAPGKAAGPFPARTGTSSKYYTGDDDEPEEVLLLEPRTLGKGIGLALLIGIISGILLEKLFFFVGTGLSILYVGMGYGIGYGLHRLTHQGGAQMAAIAVGVMVVSLLISQCVLVEDIVTQVNSVQTDGRHLPFSDAFFPILAHLRFRYWIWVFLGLGACHRGMMQQQ